MKFQDLTENEKVNVKKYIKEDLKISQPMKNIVQITNPNQLEYSRNKGLQISGRLIRMDDNQIKATVIRNVKEKLKKAV